MYSWKNDTHRQLKKVVYAINEHNLKIVIKDHEKRGWSIASDVKEHGYGVGCLMIYEKPERSSK